MFYFSIAKLLFISPNNFSNQLLVCQDGVHDFLSSSQVGDSDSRTPLAAIAESRSDAFSRSDCFCLNVSEMRHCVWNASLCLKCIGFFAISPGNKRPNLYPKSLWLELPSSVENPDWADDFKPIRVENPDWADDFKPIRVSGIRLRKMACISIETGPTTNYLFISFILG